MHYIVIVFIIYMQTLTYEKNFDKNKQNENTPIFDSIEEYQYKKTIKLLESLEGEKTCLVTLYIAKDSQISLQTNFLKNEIGQASSIKLDKTKNNVTDALVSAIELLRQFKKTPPNGLAVFSGVVKQNIGQKDKLFKLCIEPLKPINRGYFICDKKFDASRLKEMIIDKDKYGMVILDGNGFLLAVIQGNTKTVLYKESVNLPKKHGRGGQSANRFARLRLDARKNYTRKIAEATNAHFITENMPNVLGLVLAGSADVKEELYYSNLFAPCLRKIVLKRVDINYGEENGLSEAIDKCTDVFKNVQYCTEKKALQCYF